MSLHTRASHPYADTIVATAYINGLKRSASYCCLVADRTIRNWNQLEHNCSLRQGLND